MKDYYRILEININASQEIVDKAYRVLVKKYHPDLQNDVSNKHEFEEKIKEINEAYEVLSNPQKREEYNSKLQEIEKEKEQKQAVYHVQVKPQNQTQTTPRHQKQPNTQAQTQVQSQVQAEKEELARKQAQIDYQNAINKAYHDAYIQDLKNRGYKIKYKKTFNDYLRSMIALIITIGVICLILQLPFVKNYFNELYRNNEIIRSIVDNIAKIFT